MQPVYNDNNIHHTTTRQYHRKRSHTTYHHSLNGTGRDRTHVSPLTHCDTKRSSTACLHSLTVVTCNPHVTQRQDNRNSTHACNQCITITIYITPPLDQCHRRRNAAPLTLSSCFTITSRGLQSRGYLHTDQTQDKNTFLLHKNKIFLMLTTQCEGILYSLAVVRYLIKNISMSCSFSQL
jgi:hypothetical protein